MTDDDGTPEVGRLEVGVDKSDQIMSLTRDLLQGFGLKIVEPGVVEFPARVAEGPATSLFALLADASVKALSADHLLACFAGRDEENDVLIGPVFMEVERLPER